MTIRDLAVRRRLIVAAEYLINEAYEAAPDTSPERIAAKAENDLFNAVHRTQSSPDKSLAEATAEAVATIGDAYEREGGLSGIATGLIDLDRMMGGLQPSDLIILGGRPSMGKTALAVNIAWNVSVLLRTTKEGELLPSPHTHVFSLEMSAQQLAMRILSDQAGIASAKLRRGMINEDQFRHVVETAKHRLSRAAMTIDDQGGMTLGMIAAKARRIKRRHNTGLIIIDYLQLMSGTGKKNSNRVQEITEITTGLKALAKELDVPIIALSQLSRGVEQRADKRPQLSDLRESGSIEQDADVVMFVYRDEYYVEREKPPEDDPVEFAKWQQRLERAHGKAEVLLAKQRHGPIGTVELSFEGDFTRFGNLAPGGIHDR